MIDGRGSPILIMACSWGLAHAAVTGRSDVSALTGTQHRPHCTPRDAGTAPGAVSRAGRTLLPRPHVRPGTAIYAPVGRCRALAERRHGCNRLQGPEASPLPRERTNTAARRRSPRNGQRSTATVDRRWHRARQDSNSRLRLNDHRAGPRSLPPSNRHRRTRVGVPSGQAAPTSPSRRAGHLHEAAAGERTIGQRVKSPRRRREGPRRASVSKVQGGQKGRSRAGHGDPFTEASLSGWRGRRMRRSVREQVSDR